MKKEICHFDGFLQFTLHIGAKIILYFMANFKSLLEWRKKFATLMASCNSHFTLGPKLFYILWQILKVYLSEERNLPLWWLLAILTSQWGQNSHKIIFTKFYKFPFLWGKFATLMASCNSKNSLISITYSCFFSILGKSIKPNNLCKKEGPALLVTIGLFCLIFIRYSFIKALNLICFYNLKLHFNPFSQH